MRCEAQWPEPHGRAASLRSPSLPPCDHKRPRPAQRSAGSRFCYRNGIVHNLRVWYSAAQRESGSIKGLKPRGTPRAPLVSCWDRLHYGWGGPGVRVRVRAERHSGEAQRERGSLRAKQEGAGAKNEGFQAHGGGGLPEQVRECAVQPPSPPQKPHLTRCSLGGKPQKPRPGAPPPEDPTNEFRPSEYTSRIPASGATPLEASTYELQLSESRVQKPRLWRPRPMNSSPRDPPPEAPPPYRPCPFTPRYRVSLTTPGRPMEKQTTASGRLSHSPCVSALFPLIGQ